MKSMYKIIGLLLVLAGLVFGQQQGNQDTADQLISSEHSNRISLFSKSIPVTDLVYPQDGRGVFFIADSTSMVEFEWTATDTAAYDYKLKLSLDDATVILDTTLADTNMVNLNLNNILSGVGQENFTVHWNVDVYDGENRLGSSAAARTLNALQQTEKILFVNDDNYTTHGEDVASSLDAIGLNYSYFSCGNDGDDGADTIPNAEYLQQFDQVIWFTGNDGVKLGLWNGTDSDNEELISYLNTGGKLWLGGNDFIYDRYGGAPDAFSSGDFVYDYLGIEKYKAQSKVNDGGGGLPSIETTDENYSDMIDTLSWRYSTLWYADAFDLKNVEGGIYAMGPADYELAGEWTQVLNQCEYIAMTSGFNYRQFNTGNNNFMREEYLFESIRLMQNTNDIVSGPGSADLDYPQNHKGIFINPDSTFLVKFSWQKLDTTGIDYDFFLYFEDGTILYNETIADSGSITIDLNALLSPAAEEKFSAYWNVRVSDGTCRSYAENGPYYLDAVKQSESMLFVIDDNNSSHSDDVITSMDAIGLSYSVFDCGEMGSSDTVAQVPDADYMQQFDQILWYTGNDGKGLGIWNGNDEDNEAVKTYIENGGKFWLSGNDFIYDRYGSAPDTFYVGDFVYDFLGIGTYNAQSKADDGGGGLPLIVRDSSFYSAALDTLDWRYSTLYYGDAYGLRENSFPLYRMGPNDYTLADEPTQLLLHEPKHIVMSAGFDFQYLNTADNYFFRDQYLFESIDLLANTAHLKPNPPVLVYPQDHRGIFFNGDSVSAIHFSWEEQEMKDLDYTFTLSFTAGDVIIDTTVTDIYELVFDLNPALMAKGDEKFDLEWDLSVYDGITEVVSSANGPYTLEAIRQKDRILFVNDDNTTTHANDIMDSFAAINLNFSYFDCGDAGNDTIAQLPEESYLLQFEQVIWFTGNDSKGLGIWNGNDEDNPAVTNYLVNGGKLWLGGNDFMYDRYGGAPDSFAVGDFVYDYLGIAKYKAQSRVDDGGGGLAMIVRDSSYYSINLDTLNWRYSSLWYGDAFVPTEDAEVAYRMGPADYSLAGDATQLINQDNSVSLFTMSSGFNYRQFNTGNSNFMREQYVFESVKLMQNVNYVVSITDDEDSMVPLTFKVYGNYPNPFNPTTTVQYAIPGSGKVKLSVFNIMGQLLHNEDVNHSSAGVYKWKINASNWASGMYFYRVQFNSKFENHKMLLIK